MHIPSSDTAQISLLSFEEALLGSEQKDYDTDKWLYVPDFYSEYRYILGTRGKNPLICIGINPSTAEPDHLDNTLASVQRIALHNGFDSFIMFNVYAQRATDPDHMEKNFNPFLHEENMKAFEHVLSIPRCSGAFGLRHGGHSRRGILRLLRDYPKLGKERENLSCHYAGTTRGERYGRLSGG